MSKTLSITLPDEDCRILQKAAHAEHKTTPEKAAEIVIEVIKKRRKKRKSPTAEGEYLRP